MAFDADDLTPFETHVMTRTRDGEIADFAPMTQPDGAKPTLRAGFLRRLLLGLNPDWPVLMPGVRIRGARIEGVLDLSDCAGAGGAGLPALELLDCEIPEPIDLRHARLARLALDGSKLTRLAAQHARFDGPVSVHAIAAARADGVCALDFEGCDIDGAFEAHDAKLGVDPADKPVNGIGVFALHLRNARIGGNVVLRPNLVARGGVSVFGARIEGVLDMAGARLTLNHRYAFSAGNLDLSGALHMNAGFRAEGPIWMRAARLGDGLHCDGGAIVLPEDRRRVEALNAYGAVIRGGVSMRNGFNTNGAINLRSAEIHGGVNLAKATFASVKGLAFDLRNAVIHGEIAGAGTLRGGLGLVGAALTRNLDLRGATIEGAQATPSSDPAAAIDATNACFGGGVFLQNARLKGEALFADARIDGYCAFGGGRFINTAGHAIRAPNIRIGGNLTFKAANAGEGAGPVAQKTIVEGGAKFDRARIDGEVVWDGLEIRGKGGDGPCVFSLADCHIGRALAAKALHAQNAMIDLGGASCTALADDLAKGWGMGSTQIVLDGFAYERLECSEEDFRWNARTRWIRERAVKRTPQPYATLARVYAAAGRQDDMRRALRAQHDAVARSAKALSPTRIFSALFGLLAGYGLSPVRAAASLGLFLLVGAAGVLAMEARGALVTPAGTACAQAIEPMIYAIDVALPVIDLGQERACLPGRAPGAALLEGVAAPGLAWRVGEEVALWRWAHALYAFLGAVFTGLAALTFSGVMKPGRGD
jgi:hypothetical protein